MRHGCMGVQLPGRRVICPTAACQTTVTLVPCTLLITSGCTACFPTTYDPLLHTSYSLYKILSLNYLSSSLIATMAIQHGSWHQSTTELSLAHFYYIGTHSDISDSCDLQFKVLLCFQTSNFEKVVQELMLQHKVTVF